MEWMNIVVAMNLSYISYNSYNQIQAYFSTFKSVWLMEFLTRVDCSSNNTTKRIPCSIIKPVVEAIKSFFSQVSCGSVVKVRIKLVDNTLKP